MATQETLNQVQQLYVAYYGRPADAAGLAFWAGELEANGGDVSVIINDFGNSAEFEARFGDLSNEQLVNNLYQQLFGRDADAEGLAFYTGHLESGDLSLAEIASEIAGGAQDNEDGHNDLTTLNNKVAAANLYTAATEGQHDGTDADNYAAAWLAGIDADTDVDAIDMDEVVANLPEPSEPVEPEEPSIPGETIRLTPNGDTLTGTENDDTFEAPMGTQAFINGNTLNTGDVLDGGAGNDTLVADLINDAFITGAPWGGAVMPTTSNIQNVIVNAIDGSNLGGASEVVLNASRMLDVENVWSRDSNADLEIRDITTKTSDGGVRNTDALTFRMDHTANANSNGNPSDMTVYFDENYLLAGQQSEFSIQLRIVNNFQLAENDAPLSGFQTVNFAVGDQQVVVDITDATTYQQVADAINAELSAQGISGVHAAPAPERTSIFSDDVPAGAGYQQGQLAGVYNPVNIVSSTEPLSNGPIELESNIENFDGLNTWVDGDSTITDDPITTNIELHKAGRGDEGGDFHVGGKAGGSIAQFNVAVLGAEEKPSDIGFLSTGQNQGGMQQVNIATHSDYVDGETHASLTIRNGFGDGEGSQQEGLLNVNANGFLGDLSVGTSSAVENVAVFTATGGGDITYIADFDTGLTHSVTTGGGDDNIAVNTNGAFTAVDIVSTGGDNNVFVGGETPTGTVTTGNGDDLIRVASDGGTLGFAEWRADGSAEGDEGSDPVPATPQITEIELTGTAPAGGDIVVSITDGPTLTFTGAVSDGDLAAEISAAEEVDGDYSAEIVDGVITVTGPDGVEFDIETVTTPAGLDNDPEVNTQEADPGVPAVDPVDAVEGGPELFDFFGASVQVTFNGVESEWVQIDSTDYRTSAAQINAAIISAVGGTKALADVLEVDTLPGDALELNALISGSNSLDVDIRGPVANVDSTVWQNSELSTASSEAWKPYLTQVTPTQLQNAWETYFPGSSEVEGSSGPSNFLAAIQEAAQASNARYEFEDQGSASSQVSSVVINAGGGEDTIALSSNLDSTDTVVFEGNFGENTIYNFNGEAADGNGGDVLDFTSYLDVDAPGRGSSVDADVRAEEQVDFSFNNELAGDTFQGDHNEIALLSFDDLVNAYVDSLTDGAFEDDAVSFANFGASQLQAALNEEFSNFVTGGNDSSAIGNQFVILVGKDGEVIADVNGDLSFDIEYATSEFKVFSGQVVSDGDNGYAYQIDGEAGLVNLAGVDLDSLAAADFGIA